MMELNEDQKVAVLLAALAERYEALRTIRSRVENTGLWALGLMLAASGWLVQGSAPLEIGDRILALFALAGSLAVLRLLYLADLAKGFAAQQRVAAKLEEALKLFAAGEFDSTGTPMYPVEWSEAGRPQGSGRFFRSSFALLYVGAAILACALTLSA